VASSPKAAAGMPRPPVVRLAPRDELAAAARVAPLLRAARDLARWAAARRVGMPGTRPTTRRASDPGQPALSAADAAAAAVDLDLSREELEAAWQVVAGAGMLGRASSTGPADILSEGEPDAVLALWDDALSVTLRTTELDGLVTALYTVGGPVRIDALFEAYEAAHRQAPPGGSAPAGLAPEAGGPDPEAAGPASQAGELTGEAGEPGSDPAGSAREAGRPAGEARRATDVVRLSAALETLADLGVVDLGTDEEAGVLTVVLSRLGTWGVHRRLRARGWQLPVAGQLAQDPAAVLLAALADYDAEEGEAEITAWLARRGPRDAAAELMEAARGGSPGIRGAAFAVLDRIGDEAMPPVRAALTHPVLRPHAAVWLRDHGEQAELCRGDQEWLLVDLGAGLL
jgi:hypothetical protein